MPTINICNFFLLGLIIHNTSGNLRVKSTLTKLPQPLFDAGSWYNGEDTIYIVGGWFANIDDVFSSGMYKYSIASDIIQKVQNLPQALEGVSIVERANGELILVGGRRGNQFYSDEILTLNKNSLDTLVLNTTLPGGGRSHISSVQVNRTTALLFGGFSDTSHAPTSLREVLALNCSSGEFKPLANLDLPKGVATIAAVKKNEFEINLIYTIRGSDNSSKLEILGATYDVVRGKVGPQMNLNITVESITEQRAPTVVSDGEYNYIVGGIGGGEDGLPSGIYRVSKDFNSVKFYPVQGFLGGSNTYYRGNTAVYVKKFNRIYIVGGINGVQRVDRIHYIDLHEVTSSGEGIDMNVTPYFEK